MVPIRAAVARRGFSETISLVAIREIVWPLGQTESGRYLFCVIIEFPGGMGYPVTARPMTDREKRRYQEWAKRR
jgi:hypothetical protein